MNVRKVIGLIGGILSPFLLTTPAFADIPVSICPTGTFNKLCTNFTENQFGTIVGNVITILLILAIIIALLFLIYGGIKWVLSGGDKTAVEGARNHIIAAIVGLVIALLAFFIVQFALGLFGLSGVKDFTIPSLTNSGSSGGGNRGSGLICDPNDHGSCGTGTCTLQSSGEFRCQ